MVNYSSSRCQSTACATRPPGLPATGLRHSAIPAVPFFFQLSVSSHDSMFFVVFILLFDERVTFSEKYGEDDQYYPEDNRHPSPHVDADDYNDNGPK